MSPNWRQLAALPDSVLKQAILRALDIDLPPQGISRSFRDGGLYITAIEGGFTFMDSRHPDPVQRSSRLLDTPLEVARQSRWPVGTPTGEALRNWLAQHGLERPGKARPAVPVAVVATGFGPECHEGLDASDPNYQTRVVL
jgi:hypothetical protein